MPASFCLHQAVEKPNKVLKHVGQKLKLQKVVVAALKELQSQHDDGVSQAELVQWWARARIEARRHQDTVSAQHAHTQRSTAQSCLAYDR